MAKRLTVVLSQGQSQNPAKRDLEESIVAALIMESGIDVVVIPHLYDLTPDSTGMLALSSVSGHMVVLSWLFERATRWTLDRAGVQGQEGSTLLKSADDDEDEPAEATVDADGKERVIDRRDQPKRKIYCIDLRVNNQPRVYIDELKRIYSELNTQLVGLGLLDWVGGSAKPEQMQRFITPTNDTALGQPLADAPQVLRIEGETARRWYPVIDYSRCTNCMECIDFCLFGVYGVDKVDTILVEQPDNCRKGCPACSRVCPENAIIFPQHKTPAIAGSAEVAGSLKIDLSALFGAPVEGQDAVAVAARERDEQLLLAGRDAVGLSVGIAKRQPEKPAADKDEFDRLIDQLDELDI
ncbi:MAG TPA: ferredoxin family protein [Pirellulaceae bacterium]|nr:ferredoxin family protein [Pirellulaceae bacterium]